MPPRHGKSQLIARWLPTWYLLHHPDRHVVVASYVQDLASRRTGESRDDYRQLAPALGVGRLSDTRYGASSWLTQAGGSVRAVGVGTQLIGYGADLMIVDDPIRDPDQALHKNIREKQREWWEAVASTRLEPGASVIVIMHRWHQDDLAGSLIRDDGFSEIRLPALSDGDGDLLDRPRGAALWPERWPVEHLEDRRRKLSPWIWRALYQGRPQAEEGAIFRRDRIGEYVHADASPLRIQSWDLKFRDSVTGSRAAGVVIGHDGRTARIREAVYAHRGTTWAIEQIHRLRQAHQTSAILIEAKAAGDPVIEILRQQGVPGVIPVSPGSADKTLRALSVQPLVDEGRLERPPLSSAPWVSEWQNEICGFPSGQYDDLVDATTQALAYLFLRRRTLQVGALQDATMRNPYSFG